MRYLSVCSGIEAASVAWHPLRWEAVGFSEIEAFPSAVLAYRFPSVPNLGDITRYAEWNLKPGTVDLVVGGTPCQSFSVAGLRAGMADPRGNLALTFLAIVDRLRPQWVVWENVPGVLSSNGGRDFGAFLGAMVELGYGFAYRVLDAQHFGVAQRRRRVFVVANLTDWQRATAVLFEPESLRRDPAKGLKARKGLADSTGNGTEKNFGMFWNGSQVSQTLDAVLAKGQTMPEKNRFPAVLVPFTQVVNPKVATTLSARDHKGPSCGRDGIVGNPIVTSAYAVRRLTPVECERLQGFPDDWTLVPHRGKPAADSPRYKAIGNSMAVPVVRWIGERINALEDAP